MTTKVPAPLLGYNTNVRHRNRPFHLQTEDSGLKHPHVVTHLFADGGRIIASRKTSYQEHVGNEGYAAIVKRMMQEQHKAVLIALRDGQFDAELDAESAGAEMPSATNNASNARSDKPPATYVSLVPVAAAAAEPVMREDLTFKRLDEVILSYLTGDSLSIPKP